MILIRFQMVKAKEKTIDRVTAPGKKIVVILEFLHFSDEFIIVRYIFRYL